MIIDYAIVGVYVIKRLFVILFAVVSVYFFSFVAYGQSNDAEQLKYLFQRFFKPIEANTNFTLQEKAKVLLGKSLYYDKRLSNNKQYSCNGCHDLQKYGTNGKYFLALKEKKIAIRDVPTIYNLANFDLLGWTGKHKKLNQKIEGSLLHASEMQNSRLESVINRVNAITGYQPLIKKAFNTNKLSSGQLTEAISFFVQGLVTPAPIDNFMAGNVNALTPQQVAGGLMFDKRYCHSCHTGTNFGGRMIQKMGVKEPWPNQHDLGMYVDTQSISDKMFFRVSPLRNVEKTAPYFHDGSSKRMWDAVKKMGRYELGADISMADALSIQHFFKALTGKIPQKYIAKPVLPK